MASSADYLNYILDLTKEVSGITYRKMMGEYLLYKDGILFGGIYDDRFLVKKTPAGVAARLQEEIPYDGAKSMFLVDSDDPEEVGKLILETVRGLK